MIIDQLFTRPLFEQAPMASPEQLAYNKLRAQHDSYQTMTGGGGNTAVSRDPVHAAKIAKVPAELARMAAALKAKGIDAEAQYDALSGPAAAPVDANQAYSESGLRKFSYKKNRFKSLHKLQNPLGEEDAIDPSRRGFLKKAAGAAAAGAAMSAAGPGIVTLVKGFAEQAGGMNGIQALKAMLKIATPDELYNMYDYYADSGILEDAITESDMIALDRAGYDNWSEFEEHCDENGVDPDDEFKRLTGQPLKVSRVDDILGQVDDTWSLEDFFDEYPEAMNIINPPRESLLSMRQLANIDTAAKGANLPTPIVAMANAVAGLVRQIFKANGQSLTEPQQVAQTGRAAPALPAPTRPEFDMTPDLKQKEKVPVQRKGDDQEPGNPSLAPGDPRKTIQLLVDVGALSRGVLTDKSGMITKERAQEILNKYYDGEQGVAEGLTEMDKSEPSAGRDGGQQSPRRDRQSRGRDTGPREGPDREAKSITAKKATKDAADMFNQAFTDSHKKKDVKEGLVDKAAGVSLKMATPELLKMAGFIKAYIKAEAPDALPAMEEILQRLRFYSTQETGNYNIGALQNLHQLAMSIKSHLRPDSEVAPFLTEFIRIVKWYLDETIKLVNENKDPLMKKLRRALIKEGRVKELALDLKTMNDAEFMKKYGKAKAAIRKDMKRVDEARSDYTPDEMADILSGKKTQQQVDAERAKKPLKETEPVAQVNELSTEKLAQYKTAAAKDARAADQAGDFKRGDRRFHGIVQATKKQFDNDAKKVDESRAARRALMAKIVNS